MIRCSTRNVFHIRKIRRFSIVCMIWYGWIQWPSVSTGQYLRWCDFRWSIPISIFYLWSRYIDRAISTPWYTYCIWNCYIKITSGNRQGEGNDPFAGMQWNAIFDGDNRYMDDRRECGEISDSRVMCDLYIYI